MEHPPPLRLRFILQDSEPHYSELAPSSAELRDLFEIVNATTTSIVVAEGEAFIDALDLPAPVRLDAKERLVRGEPVLSYATEVVDLRRGSLVTDVLIDSQRLIEAASIVLTWAVGKGLDFSLDRVQGSQRITEFVKSMFRRSRETVEHRVSSRSRPRKTVEVDHVVETENDRGEPVIEVVMVRMVLARPGDLEEARSFLHDLGLFDR